MGESFNLRQVPDGSHFHYRTFCWNVRPNGAREHYKIEEFCIKEEYTLESG